MTVIHVYLPDGALLDGGEWVALAQPAGDEEDANEFDTFLLRSGPRPLLDPLGYRASAVVAINGEVLVIGSLGEATHFDTHWSRRESEVGDVEAFGLLNAARSVGSAVFCVGMWRQVYRWRQESGWEPAHGGVLDEREPPDRVTGFYSIDGFTEDELWAVGLGGEIWRYLGGEWNQVESPTNLMLEQVRVTPGGDVFAAGQCGLLLHGRGEQWRVIEHDATEEDLRGLEWFGGFLYVSTATSILRYDPSSGAIERLPVMPAEGTRFSRLRAGEDLLWVFGGKSALATRDGSVWRDVPVAEAESTESP